MWKWVLFHNLSFVVFFASSAFIAVAEQQRPNWVNNPLAECEKGFICAVGEGDNALSASANARSELAKQISVSIQSNASFSVKQHNDKDNTSSSLSVQEEVDEMLSGITIKEFYQDNQNKYYSFAVFDKQKMENELLAEINNLDNEMLQKLKRSPVPVKKTKQLMQTRATKNQKYMGLTGKSIDAKITTNDIRNAKGVPNAYRLGVVKNDVLNIKDFLRGEIIDNFDAISNNSDKVITGEIKMEKQYLNVDGFEKYNIEVALKCKDGDNDIGSIQVKKSGTGRNRQQIIDNTKKVILKETANQIDNLLR